MDITVPRTDKVIWRGAARREVNFENSDRQAPRGDRAGDSRSLQEFSAQEVTPTIFRTQPTASDWPLAARGALPASQGTDVAGFGTGRAVLTGSRGPLPVRTPREMPMKPMEHAKQGCLARAGCAGRGGGPWRAVAAYAAARAGRTNRSGGGSAGRWRLAARLRDRHQGAPANLPAADRELGGAAAHGRVRRRRVRGTGCREAGAGFRESRVERPRSRSKNGSSSFRR